MQQDRGFVYILTNPSYKENIIKIDDLYSDIYKVLIRVKNVYRSDKIAVSVVIDIDKNRHDCEIYIIDV